MLKAAPRPVTAMPVSAYSDSQQFEHHKRTIRDCWYPVAREEAMIGSCVQSRTLTPSVAWSRRNERMRTAIGDVDILVCGIEPERW